MIQEIKDANEQTLREANSEILDMKAALSKLSDKDAHCEKLERQVLYLKEESSQLEKSRDKGLHEHNLLKQSVDDLEIQLKRSKEVESRFSASEQYYKTMIKETKDHYEQKLREANAEILDMEASMNKIPDTVQQCECLEKQVLDLKGEIWQLEKSRDEAIHKHHLSKQSADGLKMQLERTREETESRISNYKTIMQEMEENCEQKLKETVNIKTNKKCREMKETINTISVDNAKLKLKLENAQAEVDELNDKIIMLQNSLKDAVRYQDSFCCQLEIKKAELLERDKAIAKSSKSLSELQNSLNEASNHKTTADDLQCKLEAKAAELLQRNKVIEKYSRALAELKKKIGQEKHEKQRLQTKHNIEVQDRNDEVEDVKLRMEELHDTIDELKHEKIALKEDCKSKLEDMKHHYKDDNNKARAENTRLRCQVKRARTKIQHIEMHKDEEIKKLSIKLDKSDGNLRKLKREQEECLEECRAEAKLIHEYMKTQRQMPIGDCADVQKLRGNCEASAYLMEKIYDALRRVKNIEQALGEDENMLLDESLFPCL